MEIQDTQDGTTDTPVDTQDGTTGTPVAPAQVPAETPPAPVAGTPAQPITRPASPVDSMSPAEYERLVNSAVAPGGPAAPPAPPEAPQNQGAMASIKSWFGGAFADVRALTTGLPVVRPDGSLSTNAGVLSGIATETGKGLAHAGMGVVRLGSDIVQGVAKGAAHAVGATQTEQDISTNQALTNSWLNQQNDDIDRYYGTSDSPLARATGTIVTGLSTFLATPELGAERASAGLFAKYAPMIGEQGPKVLPWLIKRGAPWVENALRFGLSQEATNTDPYGPGLAQFAAHSGVPGLDKMGADLTVNPTDNVFKARLKNMTVNTMTGVATEGLFHAVGAAWKFNAARAVLQDPAAVLPKGTFPPGVTTQAQKVDHLVSQALEHQNVINNVVDGTHIEDGAVLTAEGKTVRSLLPHENAQEFRPENNQGGTPESTQMQNFWSTLDASGVKRDENGKTYFTSKDGHRVDLTLNGTGSNSAHLEHIESTGPKGSGAGREAMDAITSAADQHGVDLTLNASPLGENPMPREVLRNYYRESGFRTAEGNTYSGSRMVRNAGDTPEAFREQVPSPLVPNPKRAELVAERASLAEKNYSEMASAPRSVTDPEQASRTSRLKQLDQAIAAEPIQIPEKSAPLKPAISMEMSSEDEAAQVANSANRIINETRSGTPSGMTQGQLDTHQKLVKDILATNDPTERARIVKQAQLNLNHLSPESAVRAHYDALQTQFNEQLQAARGKSTWAKTVGQVKGIFGAGSPEDVAAGLRAKYQGTDGLTAAILAGDVVKQKMGQGLANMVEHLDARPTDPLLLSAARQGLDAFYDFSADHQAAVSEVGRALNIRKAAPLLNPEDFKYGKTGSPPATTVDEAATGSMQGQIPHITSTMSDADVHGMLRIIKMSDGLPRSAEAVAAAALLLHKGTPLAAVTELVVNGILSSPRTLLTIMQSGMGMSFFENSSKYAAGVFTRNPQLRQRAADQMFANFSQMKDAMSAGALAMKEGRSITNPMSMGREIGWNENGPSKNIIARSLGQAIRLPGNAIQGIDEYLGVLGQRQYIVGRSLEMGRAAGLSGDALGSRVAEDLRNAYDPKTGICLVPGAVEYGQRFAFKTPLRGDQWASGFRSFTIDHPESRLIAPVIKTAGNIFDKSWQMTPGLNQLNAGYAAKIAAGGEEAAVARTQAAIGGAMWGTAMYGVMQGHVTGSGPSDPSLRKLWLKDHQPYSITDSDGNSYQYKRWEPFSTIFGLAADAHTIYHELADGKSTDPMDIAYAGVAALAHNLGSKSYLSTAFMLADAVSSGEGYKMKRFMEHMAGEGVPFSSLLNDLNPDSTQREVRGMADAVMAKVPGLSNRLDPPFNIFGEPTMKTPGYFNRAFDTWGMKKPGGHNVEDDLLELKGKLNNIASENYKGLSLDLTDRSQWNSPDNAETARGKSPWIRYNELMREPLYGQPSFRKSMENFIAGPQWERSSIGTQEFPGGSRLMEVQAIKAGAEAKAMAQVMREYPKLDSAFRLQLRAKGNALRASNYQQTASETP